MKATEKHKKIQLELGGKNPAVVLADADLRHAATQVARGGFLSASGFPLAPAGVMRHILTRNPRDPLGGFPSRAGVVSRAVL